MIRRSPGSAPARYALVMSIRVMIRLAVVVLSSLACAAEPLPADPGPTVQRMVEAVLSGDPESYLACIDRSDPVFVREQENWAHDLMTHRPATFAIELSEQDRIIHPDGSLTVPLEMTWRMQEAKRDRRVAFTARFVPDGPQWRYAGEQWVRVRAPGVEVLVEPELRTLGLHIASVLPGVRRHIDGMMRAQVDRVQQVKVYRSMEHLQQSIYLSYADPLSGWNEPGEAIKLLGDDDQSGQHLRSLLAHEYGHCATFHLGPHATDMPWWVLEGVAEYCSASVTGDSSQALRRVRRWAESDRLRDWNQLADFRGEAMNHQAYVYTQGHHMIEFLANRFGFDQVVQWLTAMARGESIQSATSLVFHQTWDEIDAQWRQSLSIPAAAQP
ncbi:MAG: hypothetical protein Kow0022_03140 [Phycisphaerales bacterium]